MEAILFHLLIIGSRKLISIYETKTYCSLFGKEAKKFLGMKQASHLKHKQNYFHKLSFFLWHSNSVLQLLPVSNFFAAIPIVFIGLLVEKFATNTSPLLPKENTVSHRIINHVLGLHKSMLAVFFLDFFLNCIFPPNVRYELTKNTYFQFLSLPPTLYHPEIEISEIKGLESILDK